MMTESSMIKFSIKQEISSLCRMRDTAHSFLKKKMEMLFSTVENDVATV